MVSPSQNPAAAPAKLAASHKKHSPKGTITEPVVAQAPLPPPTLEQMPPTAPHVLYRNGQLSINAHNSTLSQVLRSVQVQTGASIDIPSGASGERVVADLGPGQPRDVLASLLNGSHFDYVILGMPDNSGGVQKVILTARQSTPMNTAQMNAAPQQQPPPSEDDNPEEDQATYPDSDVPQGTALAPTQTQRYGQQGEQPSPDSSDPAQQQNQVKTPEQLLQELQRMQQQQQQYQQQLNPANQQPPQQ